MKETQFIDQNKEKWSAFEELTQNDVKDPERMSELFVEITNDLSFSRTYYPSRSIKVYLNNLAQKVFTSIYKNKKSGIKKWVAFWKEDLPLVMYESRKELLISFLVFTVSMIIGAVSTHNDPSFAEYILSNGYVELTNENIQKGDPMAVYKEENALLMFLYIAWNNIKVSLLTFTMGIFAAIGSIGILAFNGVMVGTFQYYFVQENLLQESFLTIWMHGAPEISCIVLAGCAGITAGKGLLFPKTFGRGESFLIGVKRGMMIMLGIIPVILVAAFVEGFVTRYTEVWDILRAMIIFSSFFAMFYYFVWLPRLKFHKNPEYVPLIERLGPKLNHKIDLGTIKRNGTIYMETFWIYVKKLRLFFIMAILSACFYSAILVFSDTNRFAESVLTSSIWTYFLSALNLFDYDTYPILLFLNTIVLSILVLKVFQIFMLFIIESNENRASYSFGNLFKKHAIKLLIFSFTLQISFLIGPWSIFVLGPFLCYLIAFVFVSMRENLGLFQTLRRTFHLFKGYWDQMIGLTIIFTFTGFLFIVLVNSSLLWFCFEILSWNLAMDPGVYELIAMGFEIFVNVAGMAMILPLYIISFGILYHSMLELKEANHLSKKIEKISERRYVLGMETEA